MSIYSRTGGNAQSVRRLGNHAYLHVRTVANIYERTTGNKHNVVVTLYSGIPTHWTIAVDMRAPSGTLQRPTSLSGETAAAAAAA